MIREPLRRNLYETTSMEMLHTRILCAQVGNRTRDLQATMSMLLQLATKPHPPTIGVRQHASDPAKRMHCLELLPGSDPANARHGFKNLI